MKNNLQFEKEIIYETIITTKDQHNNSNAAPMGIYFDEENNIIIQPFLNSITFQNLWLHDQCIIHFCDKPELFVYSALFKEELKSDLFTNLKKFNLPLLKACKNSYLIIEVIEKKKDNLKGYFKCKIVSRKLKGKNKIPYTRAFPLLIEILIHSTRIIEFRKEGTKVEEINELSAIIKQHVAIIRRVSKTESIYTQLVDKILSKLSL